MIAIFPERAVALSIGSFALHWYGLLYLAGFLVAYALLPRLQAYRSISFTKEQWASVLSAALIGVIVGGRLGYVLLYSSAWYVQNPFEVFAVWKGGMASHGGMLGVLIAGCYAARKHNVSLLHLADVSVVVIAIGLALGRIGNFVNYELYGTVTNVPWAWEIPDVEGLRHPTPLYAMMKNLSIAALCFWHVRRQPFVAGRTVAMFFVLYGVFRFIVEFVRVPTHDILVFGSAELSRGQVYSVPVIVMGLLLFAYTFRGTFFGENR